MRAEEFSCNYSITTCFFTYSLALPGSSTTLVPGTRSVQFHAWKDGVYSTDYVEKITPLFYSGRCPHYDGGIVPITYPPNGYIWKTLAQDNIAFRIYGENYYLHSGQYYALEKVLGHNNRVVSKYYHFLRTTDGRDPTGIAGLTLARRMMP